ncbi:WD40 repeat domain-containing protein [Kitasatospora sp. NPDC002227]|uniref:WD40 repeat domain-containing protein n=1 Tax=Kitasatospora sp. NPDC002227 TaxID=3154773 RepID=UPI00332D8C46
MSGAASAAASNAAALKAWAESPDGPRLCLVRGGPGSGKSRLLAWLVAESGVPVHAAVPAEGQLAVTLAWELGRQLGYGPLGPAALTARIAADPRPVRLVLPDLHKAGRGPADLPAARPEAVVTELLGPLLALPHVRLAVEAGELPVAEGTLVLDLGPGSPAPAAPAPPVAPVADWRTAPAETRERALDGALAAGTAGELLKDPGFLVHGSPVAVTAALADSRIAVPKRLPEIWAAAAPALTTYGASDAERAAVLHAAALGRDARLAEYLRPLADGHRWSAAWSRPGHRVSALALSGSGELLTADRAGRLHRWRAADGTRLGRVTAPPGLRPIGLAAVGEGCVLALEPDGTLRPVAEAVPAEADYPSLYHNGITLASPADRPTALAADGRRIVLGDAAGRLHLWSPDRLAAGPRIGRPHRSTVTAAACLTLRETGTVLVVTGGLDGTVRLWDSTTGEVMPEPVERRAAVPTALALAATAAGPVLTVAWSDLRLHVWRLFEGALTTLPLLAETDALALTPDGLAVLGGRGGTTALRLSEALTG